MEYFVGHGYRGEGNDIITNFKKGQELKGTPQYRWKKWAIGRAADVFREILDLKALEEWTLIPVPPRQCREDKLYDDRLVKLVAQICRETNVDNRELLYCHETRPSTNPKDGPKLTINDIYKNLRIDKQLVKPMPRKIILVDDVLTAGKNFKACKRMLLEHFPNIPIVGMFIARRVINRPMAGEEF